MTGSNTLNKSLNPSLRNLSLESLRMFCVLAEVGSISKTAQIICRSQPTVSLQLQKLESEVNATLIKREKGSYSLTRQGEIVLQYARQMLELNDALFHQLSQSDSRQTIRIGIPNDYIQKIWLEISTQFKDAFPQIRLEVYEDLSVNLIKMLHENAIDIALALLPKDGGQYCIYSAPKNLIWLGDTHIENHRPLPLIACFEGCTYRRNMEKALTQAQIKFSTVITSNNFVTIRDAVERGIGVTAVLEDIFHDDYLPSKLNADTLPQLDPLYFGLHVKQNNITEAISALTGIVRRLIHQQ